MLEWYHFTIPGNLIEYSTSTASLIKMPKTSEYRGYKFWYPIKCIKESKGGVSIAYTEDFEIKLKKYDKNKNLIEECAVSGSALEELFKGHTPQITPILPLTHIPETLSPTITEVDKELLDD